MSSAPVIVRRARPLLGTLVDISAQGDRAERAVQSAFAAVMRVQRLMSFHTRGSDVDRLNKLARRTPVAVHPWTWRVLREAQRLSAVSRGTFDITVAGCLVRWGYLPKRRSAAVDRRADWHDVVLLPGQRVRFRKRLLIDLGGIAKGFAVDRAIDRLRAHGVLGAMVNAGGDLRAFGGAPQRIHVRDPRHPARLIACADLQTGAVATSASYFAASTWRSKLVSPLVDRRRRASTNRSSVTVAAPTCMLADALTKVGLLRGPGPVRRLGGQPMIL